MAKTAKENLIRALGDASEYASDAAEILDSLIGELNDAADYAEEIEEDKEDD